MSETQPLGWLLTFTPRPKPSLFIWRGLRLLCLLLVSSCFSLSVLAQNTWTGNSNSSNWATPGNWSLGTVPSSVNNVVIPLNNNNIYPVIAASTTALARSIEVESGAQLTIGNSATITINISKMISGSATSFYNAGTVSNNGLIIIGNQAGTVRDYGINNAGSFTNNSGGRIQIDRSSNTALYNPGSGTFTNSATITIGASTTVGLYGLWNIGTFNNLAGQININNSSDIGFVNAINGTCNNSAIINIGASSTVGRHGLNNRNVFNNSAGGKIQIDRSSEIGLYNLSAGTFTNSSTITIGASATVGNHGLKTDGSFTNTTGGNIKIDRSDTNGLVTETGGSFTNSATITIGASSSVGTYGLQNRGTFLNTGGQIQIDRAINTGLFSTTAGTFTNSATITIGASTTVGLYGFWSNGIFNHNAGGLIKVDNSSDIGFVNGSNGTFTNAAPIVIGSLAAVGRYGFENKGIFANNLGGQIQIDRSTLHGLITDPGSTFTNSATITIGASATVGVNGIINIGSFNNNLGAQIQVNRSSDTGLFNPGSFTNSASISIGASATVGSYGLLNIGIFKNTAGQINIDNSSEIGLLNVESSTFTNSATIVIGALAAVGTTGVLNYTAATFNNAGCAALLNIVANAIISNANSFSNSGTIIENATGNSTISFNSGLILNLNGGSFTVTSGAQPLSLSTAPPTNCSPPANGSITISGLQAITTYTLSYTTNGTTTTLNPNPVSDANGEVTITGLSAGTYTLSLGGSCVPQNLPLSATVNGPLTPTLSLGTIPTICAGVTSLVLPYTATTGSPNAYSLLGAGITPVSGGSLATAPASITINLSSPATTPLLDFTLLASNTLTGCVSASSIPVSITVNARPNASLIASGTLTCTTTTISLTASGGDNYAFSGPDAGPTGVVASAGNSATVNVGGLYSVTVTNTTTGCFSTTTNTVESTTGIPSVSISPLSATLTCATPSLTLTATGSGISYVWTGGSTGTSLAVNTAAMYSVTATGVNGCTAVSNTVTVAQDFSIPGFTVSSVSVCATQSATLLASGCNGGVVIWPNGTTGSTFMAIASSSSLISATCTIGSCSATASGSLVAVLPPPAAILSLTINESGCPVRLQGRGVGSLFVFTGPGGYVFSNVYRNGGTYDIFAEGVLTEGIYTLTSTYTNSCGTSTPVSQIVQVTRNCP